MPRARKRVKWHVRIRLQKRREKIDIKRELKGIDTFNGRGRRRSGEPEGETTDFETYQQSWRWRGGKVSSLEFCAFVTASGKSGENRPASTRRGSPKKPLLGLRGGERKDQGD